MPRRRKTHRPEAMPAYMFLAHTIECGLLHTGLPSCCVAYFVSDWLGMSPADREGYRKEVFDALPKIGYVPCPRCLKRRDFVIPKACACPQHFRAGMQAQYDVDTGALVPIPGQPGAFRSRDGVPVLPRA